MVELMNNSFNSGLVLVKDIYVKLDISHKKKLFFLIIYTIFTASLEVFSLGLVVPFLGILLNETYLNNVPILTEILTFLSFGLKIKSSLLISIIFIFAAIIVAISRIYLLKFSALFVVSVGSNLSLRVFENYLKQHYSFHIKKNSSDIISDIREKVDLTVFAVLLPSLTLITNLIIVLSIIIFLFFVNFKIASIISLIFLPIYIFVVLKSKQRLHQNSLIIQKNQPKTIRIVQESIGNIRDIILNKNQNFYLKKYQNPDFLLRLSQAKNILIASIPRYILECIGIVLIASIAIFVILTNQSLIEIIPILGTLALGAQRILPLLQQVYAAWASIAGYGTSSRDVLNNLSYNNNELSLKSNNIKTLPFQHSIIFKNVSFKYHDSKKEVIKNLNFEIRKGDKVALIGKTGSGKSTIIDLITGLLKPQTGEILIDGKVLTSRNLHQWQQNISLVPQTIFLSDESIIENICLGLEKKEISMKKFKNSIDISCIKSFIDSLPQGYKTLIGERGVRLSGGQRQRIGLARSFYKNKNILILDEATNALDIATETKILNNLKSLSENITLIIISHRPKTVSFCNKIIKV